MLYLANQQSYTAYFQHPPLALAATSSANRAVCEYTAASLGISFSSHSGASFDSLERVTSVSDDAPEVDPVDRLFVLLWWQKRWPHTRFLVRASFTLPDAITENLGKLSEAVSLFRTIPLECSIALSLKGIPTVTIPSALSPHVSSIDVIGPEEANLEGLGACTRLTSFSCREVKSLCLDATCRPNSLKQLLMRGCSSLIDLNGFECCSNLEVVDVGDCSDLKDLSALERISYLRVLRAESTSIKTVANMNPSIQKLCVDSCEKLESFEGLSVLRSLTELSARCVPVTTLSGLEGCLELRILDLFCCAELRCISALADNPCLKDLNLYHSDVRDLSALRTCPSLETVDVFNCGELLSLYGLCGMPSLVNLYAGGTSITHLDGLSSCPLLEQVDVGGCVDLTSCAGLARSPKVKDFNACGSLLQSLSELSTCEYLESIDVSYCSRIVSLADLAALRRLKKVNAEATLITNLDGLNSCTSLELLIVSECPELTSLTGIEGSKSLKEIRAERSAITNLDGLRSCPSLEVVRARDCAQLSSASDVCRAPSLKTLDIRGTPLEGSLSPSVVLC